MVDEGAVITVDRSERVVLVDHPELSIVEGDARLPNEIRLTDRHNRRGLQVDLDDVTAVSLRPRDAEQTALVVVGESRQGDPGITEKLQSPRGRVQSPESSTTTA